MQNGIVGGAMQPQQKQPEGGQGALNDLSPEASKLVARALDILYADGSFKKLIDMFKQYGAEGFHEAMATAINGILGKLEKEVGGIQDLNIVGEVGTRLFEVLLEDLVEGGVLKEVTPQMAANAIQQTLAMWAQRNGGRVPKENVAATAQQLQQLAGGQQV